MLSNLANCADAGKLIPLAFVMMIFNLQEKVEEPRKRKVEEANKLQIDNQ